MAGGFVIDGAAIDIASGFGIGAGEIFISFIAKVNDVLESSLETR